jgi:hypothetical protein
VRGASFRGHRNRARGALDELIHDGLRSPTSNVRILSI